MGGACWKQEKTSGASVLRLVAGSCSGVKPAWNSSVKGVSGETESRSKKIASLVFPEESQSKSPL